MARELERGGSLPLATRGVLLLRTLLVLLVWVASVVERVDAGPDVTTGASAPKAAGAHPAATAGPPQTAEAEFRQPVADLFAFAPETFLADGPLPEAVGAALADSGVKALPKGSRAEERKWDLLWTTQFPPEGALENLSAGQRANHLPGSSFLTKKESLLRHLQAMEGTFRSEYAVMPRSFLLPEQWDNFTSSVEKWKNDHESLAGTVAAGLKPSPWTRYRWTDPGVPVVQSSAFGAVPAVPAVVGGRAETDAAQGNWNSGPVPLEEPRWLVKRLNHSGVEVVRDEAGLRSLRQAGTPCVAQAYVPPLLIDDHKFEVGFYVLVTSVEPLRAYIYDDALLRFCPDRYPHTFAGFTSANQGGWVVPRQGYKTASDFATLRSVAERHVVMEGALSPGLRVGKAADLPAGPRRPADLRVLQDYLVQNRPSSASLMLPRVEDRIRKALLAPSQSVAAAIRQTQSATGVFFELFRFDFLLDEELVPHLMEVNMSPSLPSRPAGSAGSAGPAGPAGAGASVAPAAQDVAGLFPSGVESLDGRDLVDEIFRVTGVSVAYNTNASVVLDKLRGQVIRRGNAVGMCAAPQCAACPVDSRCVLCDHCLRGRTDFLLREMLLEHHRLGSRFAMLLPTVDPVLRGYRQRSWRAAHHPPNMNPNGPAELDEGSSARQPPATSWEEAEAAGERAAAASLAASIGAGQGGGHSAAMFGGGGGGADEDDDSSGVGWVSGMEATLYSYCSYLPFLPCFHAVAPSKLQRGGALRTFLGAQVAAERLYKIRSQLRGEWFSSPHFSVGQSHLTDASDSPLPAPMRGTAAQMAAEWAASPVANTNPYRVGQDGKRLVRGWGFGSSPGVGPDEVPMAGVAGGLDGSADSPDGAWDGGKSGKGPGHSLHLGSRVDPSDAAARNVEDEGGSLGLAWAVAFAGRWVGGLSGTRRHLLDTGPGTAGPSRRRPAVDNEGGAGAEGLQLDAGAGSDDVGGSGDPVGALAEADVNGDDPTSAVTDAVAGGGGGGNVDGGVGDLSPALLEAARVAAQDPELADMVERLHNALQAQLRDLRGGEALARELEADADEHGEKLDPMGLPRRVTQAMLDAVPPEVLSEVQEQYRMLVSKKNELEDEWRGMWGRGSAQVQEGGGTGGDVEAAVRNAASPVSSTSISEDDLQRLLRGEPLDSRASSGRRDSGDGLPVPPASERDPSPRYSVDPSAAPSPPPGLADVEEVPLAYRLKTAEPRSSWGGFGVWIVGAGLVVLVAAGLYSALGRKGGKVKGADYDDSYGHATRGYGADSGVVRRRGAADGGGLMSNV